MTKKARIVTAFSIVSGILLTLALPISFFAYIAYVSKISEEQGEEIRQKFQFLCKGKSYLYSDFAYQRINIGNESSCKKNYLAQKVSNIESNVKHVSISSSFLYTDENIYFVANEELNNNHNRLAIFKMSTGLFTNVNKVVDLFYMDNPTSKDYDWSFGYDNMGYFRYKDSYISYNFKTFIVDEFYQDDKRTNLCVPRTYRLSLGVEKSKCIYKNHVCTYTYNGENYAFKESDYIDESLLNEIHNYNFKPNWHISFPNGITSLVYYCYEQCVVVTYNRNEQTLKECQYFHDVADDTSSYLFPLVDL